MALSRALTLELLPKRRDAPRGHAYGSPAATRGRAATNAARGKLTIIMHRAALVLATARLIQGEYVRGVPSNWHASRHFAKLVEYESIVNVTFGLRAPPATNEHWRPYWTKDNFATLWRVEAKRRQRRAPRAATIEDACRGMNGPTIVALDAAALASIYQLASRRAHGTTTRELGVSMDISEDQCGARATAVTFDEGELCPARRGGCRVRRCAFSDICAHTHPSTNRPSASDLRAALDAHPCAGLGGKRRLSLVLAPKGVFAFVPSAKRVQAFAALSDQAKENVALQWARSGREDQSRTQRGDAGPWLVHVRGLGFDAAYLPYQLLEAASSDSNAHAVLLLRVGEGSCRRRRARLR